MGDMPSGAIPGAPPHWEGMAPKGINTRSGNKTLAKTRTGVSNGKPCWLELESNGDGKGGEGR